MQTILLLFLLFAQAGKFDLGGLYELEPDISATQADKDRVQLSAVFNGKHLIVDAKIASGWHLYSVTQPKGGTIRTTFTEWKVESGELEVVEIRPAVEPHINKTAAGFDVDIEEHDHAVRWILTFQDELPKNTAVIKGKLDGQICQSGEGGMCIPITVPFEAKYSGELEIPKAAVADRFIWKALVPLAADKKGAEHPDALIPFPVLHCDPPREEVLTPVEIGGVSSLGAALLYAFLGGIVLNFMPCVLPVIGLKVLSFFEQAQHSRSKALLLNVAYSLGLLSVFMVLAFVSLGLSILFTFDVFNIVMACVVFAMALSLMEVWDISVPGFIGRSKLAARQEGFIGAFSKGIITTLLAIPCGAPLLSPAVKYADGLSTLSVFMFYAVIGLGMASPYLVTGAFPELLRFLPKPGQWMETFRKCMGFCLLFAVVWILYFVQLERLLPTVALLFAVWFACWFYGQCDNNRRPALGILIGIAVVGATTVLSFNFPNERYQNRFTLESAMVHRLESMLKTSSTAAHWKPYSKQTLEAALADGKTVVIDFTADWCVNCKVLEATVLQSETVLKMLDKKGIVSLTADCTRNGGATELLKRLGPRQVPVLAVFKPQEPDKPRVIRGGYTVKTAVEAIE